jgi:hypothetical protein
MSEWTRKTVTLTINDQANRELLREEFVYQAAHLKPEFSWASWETVRVDIFENGSLRSRDPYSVILAEKGRRVLVSLTYQYDGQQDRFVRVRAEPGVGD